MRNPWGRETYTGPWSDNDSRWTAAYREQLGHKVANDGVFYMDVATYKKHFTEMQMAFYDSWNHSHKDATWDRTTYGKWTIDNTAAQEFVVGV